MCSATQEGLRSLRSKEEIRACRVARSATGPGNPYWKSPAGSTGGMISLAGRGRTLGIGAGTDVVDVADTDVEEATAWAFFSERVEYIAAVTPAPVAADTAAMIARVAFDILQEGVPQGWDLGVVYIKVRGRWEGKDAGDQGRDRDARGKIS